jgi:hypothetical protein
MIAAALVFSSAAVSFSESKRSTWLGSVITQISDGH